MNPPVAPDTAATSSPRRWAWGLVFLALCTWHAWLTLTLFGETRPWEGLISDEPIISGRHPLHLYHGYLGARSLIETGTSCCYDPAFQAGYPKTPIFDSGSRPAELFLLLGGGAFRPAAYKLGLAACSLLVPWALLATARGMGLTLGPACLAGALGLGVWWGEPCRELLEVGDLDLLLAALAGLVHVGLLLRYDRQPSFSAWITLLAVNAVGWFAHPFFFSLLIPLNLVYYLTVGTRHRHPLAWHFGLGSALLGGILANGFWLIDWVQYWWIRSPLPVGIPILTHRTLYAFWTADLWGEEVDRALAVFLLSAGLLGIVVLNIRKERAAARLFGLAAGCALTLAVVGIAWEPLGRVGSPRLLVPALWFATYPAVDLLVCIARGVWNKLARPSLRAAAIVVPSAGVIFLGHSFADPLLERAFRTIPLVIGLGPERRAAVATLVEHTSSRARILWEDQPSQAFSSRWSVLLPMLTERVFLGGLDPRADFDFSYAGLSEGKLAGRPLPAWSDADLEEFCRRYNVGWIACWSPTVVSRLRSWPLVREVIPLPLPPEDLPPGAAGCLFALRRTPSYVLKGQAEWLVASRQRLVLTDLVPEDGKVVLSLHYESGWQATPSRVQVEREPDPYDPIPFIRLRLPGPVTRVTLIWENP